MRRLTAIILVVSLLLLLPACAAANQPVTDLKALEKQVLADWVALKNESIKRPHEFDAFYYYGTDNGYHIIFFHLAGPSTADSHSENIAGYQFDHLGGGNQLKAYKNGKFYDLEIAYFFCLVSKDAVAKAAELHAEKKNATE